MGIDKKPLKPVSIIASTVYGSEKIPWTVMLTVGLPLLSKEPVAMSIIRRVADPKGSS